MKYILMVLIAVWSLSACKQTVESELIKLTRASEKMLPEDMEAFKYSIMRYTGKLPGKADHITKFDTIFDSHYQNLATQHDLLFYEKSGDTVYFLITRMAPSLYEKKVAIGGKLSYGKDGRISYYEEAFRTWKMLVPELEQKAELLFGLYLSGKDLSPYYTINSKGVEYIEFPDEDVYYDTEKRFWVSKREDPLEELYDMKR